VRDPQGSGWEEGGRRRKLTKKKVHRTVRGPPAAVEKEIIRNKQRNGRSLGPFEEN